MTEPPHNPDDLSFQDFVHHEPIKGYLQGIDGPNATVTDEDTRDFIAKVEASRDEAVDRILGSGDILAKYATGGIVRGGPVIGEHHDCYPFGRLNTDDSPLSKMLADATSLEVHWPEALKARRDQAIAAGYSDSTTISYWTETRLGEPTPITAPTAATIMAAIQKAYGLKDEWLPPQPRAYRMHPDTIDSVRRGERLLPWQDPSLLGTPVIPDSRVPAGWMVSDDIISDIDGDNRYRFEQWPYDPEWFSNGSHPAADSRTPAGADPAEGDPSTGDTGDVDGWNKPEPSHWCAGWALLLGLGVLGAVVILVAAGLVTLAAMLGWLG